MPVKVHGLVVCGTPIGDDDFVTSWLAAKADEISSAIKNITSKLSSRSAVAAQSVSYYPSQSLADFVCSTYLPSQTTFLRTKVDSALRSAFEMVYGVDFLDPLVHGSDPTTPRTLPLLAISLVSRSVREAAVFALTWNVPTLRTV